MLAQFFASYRCETWKRLIVIWLETNDSKLDRKNKIPERMNKLICNWWWLGLTFGLYNACSGLLMLVDIEILLSVYIDFFSFSPQKVNLGQVSDDQRFILANPQGQCQDCVTIKSVSTKLYLSTSGTGRIMTTTNTSSNRAWFDLYTCGQALMAICNSTIAC